PLRSLNDLPKLLERSLKDLAKVLDVDGVDFNAHLVDLEANLRDLRKPTISGQSHLLDLVNNIRNTKIQRDIAWMSINIQSAAVHIAAMFQVRTGQLFPNGRLKSILGTRDLPQ
ncbi:hypothetical protein H0H92_015236, partial [Tricholoma furcatifolium]